jgi:uncharacterized Ntn-hydrolase superfamily protein
LAAETQHDQAGVILRWVSSYVGKVQVQGYQNPAFGLAGLGQIEDITADELLIVYRHRLVASYDKLSGQFYR